MYSVKHFFCVCRLVYVSFVDYLDHFRTISILEIIGGVRKWQRLAGLHLNSTTDRGATPRQKTDTSGSTRTASTASTSTLNRESCSSRMQAEMCTVALVCVTVSYSLALIITDPLIIV